MKSTPTNPPAPHWLDAWHVNPAVNRDYDFIDGLRGLAMLMVLAAHLLYVNPKSGPMIQFLGACSGSCAHGVTLFFALSGFLIAWPFWKRKIAGAEGVVPPGYAWRRFCKIYPPLALSVLLLTSIYILRSGDWSYAGIAARWFVGLPFFVPVSGRLNPVMWSLVVEIQFYIVLPLLFLTFKRVSAKSCLWIMTLLFLVVPITTRLITGHGPAFSPNINGHFPSGLDCFCLGIFVAGLENLGFLRRSHARIGVLGLVWLPLTLVACAWLNLHPDLKTPGVNEVSEDMIKLAAGCLLFFVAAPQHPVARVFCAPWLRWCGIVSYEWYLFHQPIIGWARGSFGPAGGSVLKYVGVVGGSLLTGLILAAIVYRFFSLPILKRWRGKRARLA